MAWHVLPRRCPGQTKKRSAVARSPHRQTVLPQFVVQRVPGDPQPQRGSSESKKPDGPNEVDEDPEQHRGDPDAPSPVRRGGWRLALYKNSLGIAFFVLFVISFVGHAANGARKFNQEEQAHGSTETVTAAGYMATAQFWYESLQNWQSEFLAVLAIVLLSIWLRQWGSPESKPVHAPHSDTGSS